MEVGTTDITWYTVAIEGHHDAYTKFKADKLKLLFEHPSFLFFWWIRLCRLGCIHVSSWVIIIIIDTNSTWKLKATEFESLSQVEDTTER